MTHGSIDLADYGCALTELVRAVYVRNSVALFPSPARAEPSDEYFERVLNDCVTRGAAGQPQWTITDRKGFDAWLARVSPRYMAWRAKQHDVEIALARRVA